MLINEYRLEIQFKKVRKVRNINNIPMVGNGRVPTIGPAQNEVEQRSRSRKSSSFLLEKI